MVKILFTKTLGETTPCGRRKYLVGVKFPVGFLQDQWMVAKQTLPSEFVVRLELNRLGQQRARVLLQLALSLF